MPHRLQHDGGMESGDRLQEMTLLAILLALALLAAVGFAAFQLSEARRWRESAEETRTQVEQQTAALQEARHAVVQKDAEAAKHKEIAESQLRLLTQTHQQVEERFRSLANDALQNNSQLFLDRSRDQFASSGTSQPIATALRRTGASD